MWERGREYGGKGWERIKEDIKVREREKEGRKAGGRNENGREMREGIGIE